MISNTKTEAYKKYMKILFRLPFPRFSPAVIAPSKCIFLERSGDEAASSPSSWVRIARDITGSGFLEKPIVYPHRDLRSLFAAVENTMAQTYSAT